MLIIKQPAPTARHREAGTDFRSALYDERKRSRLKVTLASGAEAGIFLERGDHLRGGDKLAGRRWPAVVEILAAPEKLIEAVADSPLLFARAAYHLGNRHVPVQILPTENGGKLRFQTDHVLADMVRGLGLLGQRNRGARSSRNRRLRLTRWPPHQGDDDHAPTCTTPARPASFRAENPPVQAALNTNLQLARLLQLASPALPVGAYTYSQGLEWAVESGVVVTRRAPGTGSPTCWTWHRQLRGAAGCGVDGGWTRRRCGRIEYSMPNSSPAGNPPNCAQKRPRWAFRCGACYVICATKVGRGCQTVEALPEVAFPTVWAGIAAAWQIEPEAALTA